jgi:hypothetical protein
MVDPKEDTEAAVAAAAVAGKSSGRKRKMGFSVFL